MQKIFILKLVNDNLSGGLVSEKLPQKPPINHSMRTVHNMNICKLLYEISYIILLIDTIHRTCRA